MSELFDKLILRIVFTLFICGILFLYKYAHLLFYPSSRFQLFKRFYPAKNAPSTIHLFSRIIGIGIIFSEFYFYMSDGIFMALFDFLILSCTVSSIYLLGVYIVDSIVLYNFEYSDEVLKRKNYNYALITFAHAIGVATLLKKIVSVSNDSLIVLFFLWLFAIVLIGVTLKFYNYVSSLPVKRLMGQESLAMGFNYLGVFFGTTIIISSALNHQLENIKWYIVQVILKILLSIIIFPFFKKGLIFIFKIQDELKAKIKQDSAALLEVETGVGVFEGSVFFTACFLTTIITGQIHFGTFYPIF
jgi:hypothetical protein